MALDWRRVGNTALELGLASAASGPVDRVWYADNGSRLFLRTALGRVFETTDFEKWKLSTSNQVPSEPASIAVQNPPETSAKIRAAFGKPGRLYAAARNAFRSDDGGLSWINVTQFEDRSILGEGLSDLAVSPRDPEEVVVAGTRGVWRSMDGGSSWTGLNQQLPNLPVRRFARMVANGAVRLVIDDTGTEVEWGAGEKNGWRLSANSVSMRDAARRAEIGRTLVAQITAVTPEASVVYAGASDGRLYSTTDGRNWQPFKFDDDGAVTAIYADGHDPTFAVALLSGRRSQVVRTPNGGRFWENITDNLPSAAHGVTADAATGTVYAATDTGVYMTAPGTSGTAPWTLVKPGKALDVMLDADANQLYAAFEGVGVYAALAPHRLRDPRVVSSGDLAARAAAPGSLLTVVGARVQAAHAGELTAPVLAASDTQSQIQVPFDAAGSVLSLALDLSSGRTTMGLPLQNTSPSIFVDPDGSPLIVNADNGLVLDSSVPAKPGSRLQIFTTGLGKVRPDWPTGIAAPIDNSPRVVAPVTVYLDREPLPVSRAVLAPGYVGFYLVEVQLPDVVNAGTSELYLETGGHQSNHVRIYLEP